MRKHANTVISRLKYKR